MKNKKSIIYPIILVLVVVVFVNILSDRYFIRLDLTEDNQFTLSDATKNILDELDEVVTVTAYFTDDLPQNVAKTRNDFKDLLIEYSNISRGKLVYEFVNPSKDKQIEQKAIQSGVKPVVVNIREKDQVKQQKVFLGAVIQIGEKSEAIPVIQPGEAMEYSLSTNIKKLSVIHKPVLGFLQGHGEPALDALQEVKNSLSILYNIEDVLLDKPGNDLSKYKTIAIVSPADTFPDAHLKEIDKYLEEGGNLFIAYNRVIGDFSKAQGKPLFTGLENWLSQKGIQIENNFIVDANCGSIGVQQQQGRFNFTRNVKFPYLPLITNFKEHPITEGIETVILPLVSSITYTGDTSLTFIPLATTSNKTGTVNPPLTFDVNKDWNNNDFPLSKLTVAALVSGKIVGDIPSNMVVVSDGDFPVNGSGQKAHQLQPGNVNLMVNSIDWLSDDTGLIELRTKGIAARPLDQIEDGTKAFLKWFNFLLPLILVVFYGVFRIQRNRNIRIKRMEEAYV